MKRIVLIFVCGLVFCDCYSQNPLVKQWDKRFGGNDNDLLNSFQQTTDGGYILTGYTRSGISGDKTEPSQGWDDYWMVKIDSLGIKQWDKRFGGTDIDYLYTSQQTADNGYILGGNSYSGIGGDKTQANWGSSTTHDYWIVKTDSFGVKQWDKRFGGSDIDWLSSLQQTTDGGYILGGFSGSGISGDKTQPSWGGRDYWIVKTDSLGIKQWDKRFGGTDQDYLFSIKQTTDGGYILGGYSYSGIGGDKTEANWDPGGSSNDYWIVKTDSLGIKQWDKRFGGTNSDFLYSLQQTTDKGYILGGISVSGISGDKTQASQGDYDYWILKTDSAGAKQWDKRFGGSAIEDVVGNITQTSDDGYLIAGLSYSNISGDKTENNLGLEQTWVVKTDSLGIAQWDKTIFTAAHDEYALAIRTKDGCYAMANYTDGGIGGYKTQPGWGSTDYWIVKFCDSTSTTSINNLQSSTFNLQLFPNPATATIQLTLSNFSKVSNFGKGYCEIINVMGEKVHQAPLPASPRRGEGSYAVLDVSFLAKGIYLLRVGDGESFENKKLVIE